MERMAIKTKQETVSMHSITILTLIFLPGTFLAVCRAPPPRPAQGEGANGHQKKTGDGVNPPHPHPPPHFPPGDLFSGLSPPPPPPFFIHYTYTIYQPLFVSPIYPSPPNLAHSHTPGVA